MCATPEELIRQRLLQAMVTDLGYPKGLLAVEKEVSSVRQSDCRRRFDIVCYIPSKDGLFPLLLVECKAKGLGIRAERQVQGYNSAIGAPFIALAGAEEIRLYWCEMGKVSSVPFLPPFSELVKAFK